jgi:hypothetical protein
MYRYTEIRQYTFYEHLRLQIIIRTTNWAKKRKTGEGALTRVLCE